MIYNRVRFSIQFETDMDSVEGWGDNPDDWRRHLEEMLSMNSHYHPTFEISEPTMLFRGGISGEVVAATPSELTRLQELELETLLERNPGETEEDETDD